jgi:hypothetical protein
LYGRTYNAQKGNQKNAPEIAERETGNEKGEKEGERGLNRPKPDFSDT